MNKYRITIEIEADDLDDALVGIAEGVADGSYDGDLQQWDDESHSWVAA